MGCSDWQGYDCAAKHDGYTEVDTKDLLKKCPKACGTCKEPSTEPPMKKEAPREPPMESDTEPLKEHVMEPTESSVQPPTACKDNLEFTDVKGYACSDWQGYDCAAKSDGYTEVDTKDLLEKCPKACGTCQEPSTEQPPTEHPMETPTEPTKPPTQSLTACKDNLEFTDVKGY